MALSEPFQYCDAKEEDLSSSPSVIMTYRWAEEQGEVLAPSSQTLLIVFAKGYDDQSKGKGLLRYIGGGLRPPSSFCMPKSSALRERSPRRWLRVCTAYPPRSA